MQVFNKTARPERNDPKGRQTPVWSTITTTQSTLNQQQDPLLASYLLHHATTGISKKMGGNSSYGWIQSWRESTRQLSYFANKSRLVRIVIIFFWQIRKTGIILFHLGYLLKKQKQSEQACQQLLDGTCWLKIVLRMTKRKKNAVCARKLQHLVWRRISHS